MTRDAHGTPAGAWLDEPTTTLTDYAITLVAGWLAVRLLDATTALAPALLAAAFVAVALAALLGGTVHGFGVRLGEARRALLWRLTLQLAVATNALLLAAVIVARVPAPWERWLLAATVAKALGFAHFAWWRRDFRWAVYDSLVTFAAIAVVEGIALARHDAPGAWWMLGGVAVSVVAGAVQRSGLTAHRHLNHNDLYHVVQLVAVFLFYRGGLLLAAS